MGDVIRASFTMYGEIPPNKVLANAMDDADPLDTVLVIGKRQDGGLYLACSTGDGGETALLIWRAQQHLAHHIAKAYGDPL